MERVKLTFERNGEDGRIIIVKDGGFSVGDMRKVTDAVESLFNDTEKGRDDDDEEVEDTDEEAVEEGGDEEEEQDDASRSAGGEGDKEAFIDRVQKEAQKAAAASRTDGGGKPLGDTTPPEGRGRGAAKLPDGTGITKQGTIDRRTLKGTPQHPDRQQQKTVKHLENEARE